MVCMADVLPIPQPHNIVLLRQSLRLLKAFMSIDDTVKRDFVVEFVEGLASGGGPAVTMGRPSTSDKGRAPD